MYAYMCVLVCAPVCISGVPMYTHVGVLCTHECACVLACVHVHFYVSMCLIRMPVCILRLPMCIYECSCVGLCPCACVCVRAFVHVCIYYLYVMQKTKLGGREK